MEIEIKKVIKRIYSFDFSKTELRDGEEIISQSHKNEFVTAFQKRDLDNGIVVSPSGYKNGFVYKSSNDGEIYNNPQWLPDIVNFALNIYGLKKDSFYKLTFVGRATQPTIMDTTKDRTIEISNSDNELIVYKDLGGIYENIEQSGIFKANSSEVNLFFRVGKIFISDIIIDEVELLSDNTESIEEDSLSEFAPDKIQVVSYAVFTTQSEKKVENAKASRYLSATRLTGKGISLFFDTQTNQYVLERDNREDILGESFTNINYLVDFNMNKLVNKGYFSQYNIVEVSSEASPNNLKSGFIRFEFVDDNGNPVKYSDNTGRIAVIISKIF